MKKSIIIILGEPNSISSEIFLKSLNYIKKLKLNYIIIGNYSLLEKQAKYLNIRIKVNLRLTKINNLQKAKFNFINVDYNQIKPFELKFRKSEQFIKKCFEYGILLLKKNLASGLINLPIDKSKFTKNKYKMISSDYKIKITDDNIIRTKKYIFIEK